MLFFISLLMVFASSYMIACIVSPKDKNNRAYGPAPFLYILLTMFAQIVITIEGLSLFKAINENNVLVINVLFLIASGVWWFKKERPFYIPRIKEKFAQIWKALKRDKILMIMGFGFVFMLLAACILDIILPVSSGDALTYHLNRASFWMHQGSLNHFTICDDRNLVMPINSEIIYLWNLLFFKGDIGLFFVAFIGYIAAIFSIYNILEYFNFSKRRILWSIFIVSSFASVICEISSLETDVLIAGLVLSSIALFLFSLKERKTSMIFYSALAYALAMGTKSPAVIAFPPAFILMGYFAFKHDRKEFYKPLTAFLMFLFLNFLVFSSYNYVLNFISFGNPLGSESARAVHGFRGGFKAFIANFIRYIYLMFDFSGFRYSEYVGEHILNAREAVLSFLHIPMDLGVEMSDNNEINNRLINVKTGAGILGFLLFLPSVLTSFILYAIKRNNKKIEMIFMFGLMFFLNLICLSFSIAYMVFSVRFLTFLIVISAPVLAVSYIRKTNLIKLLILFFAMSYFVIISVNLSGRQFRDIAITFLKQPTLSKAREQIRCALYVGYEGENSYCYLRDNFVTKLPKGTKIALFPDAMDRVYIFDILNSHGYKIETLLPENAPNYNYDKYDYIITTKQVFTSTVLLKETKDIETKYHLAPDGRAYYEKYSPFSCIYETHGRGFYVSSMKDKAVVMDSRCYIDYNFFKDRNFSVLRIYDFKNENIRFQNYVTIYKNKKLKN